MQACYILLTIVILNTTTLIHANAVHTEKPKQKRSVYDIIPHSNNIVVPDNEDYKKIGINGIEANNKQSGTPKMYRKMITKLMREKIRKFFRVEEKNVSSLLFLKDMQVLSEHIEAILRT